MYHVFDMNSGNCKYLYGNLDLCKNIFRYFWAVLFLWDMFFDVGGEHDEQSPRYVVQRPTQNIRSLFHRGKVERSCPIYICIHRDWNTKIQSVLLRRYLWILPVTES